MMESHFRCKVEPHPDGAQIETELEVIPHGLFQLVLPLFLCSFKHEIAAAEKMRITIEARYGDTAASA